MLESGGVLRTWALDRPPDDEVAGGELFAAALADHRIAYLEYEGDISGKRGRVTRYDRGDYEIVIWETDRIVVDLHGARLRGQASFALIGPSHQWQFSFSPAPPEL